NKIAPPSHPPARPIKETLDIRRTRTFTEAFMAQSQLRVGLIGAGANTRSRHIPGLKAVAGVEIMAVCNRRPSSTEAVAREYGIPRTYATWQEVVHDPDIDAIVIGTWPYL